MAKSKAARITAIMLAVVLAMSSVAFMFSVSAADDENVYQVNETTAKFIGRTYEYNGTDDRSAAPGETVNFTETYPDYKGARMTTYGNAGVEIRFTGTSFEANMLQMFTEGQFLTVVYYIDSEDCAPEDAKFLQMPAKKGWVTFAEDLEDGEHTIRITKMSRNFFGFMQAGSLGVKEFRLSEGGRALTPNAKADLQIAVYGDSISNGDATWSFDGGATNASFTNATYAANAARYFDADIQTIANTGNGLISSVMMGDDGKYFNLFYPQKSWSSIDEYCGNGPRTAKWDYDETPMDVVIINLGTNDQHGVRNGSFTHKDYTDEYLKFADQILADCPDAKILCVLGAMGAEILFEDVQFVADSINEKYGDDTARFIELEHDNKIPGGLGYDNGHPSVLAHQIYGLQIAKAIQEMVPAKTAGVELPDEIYNPTPRNLMPADATAQASGVLAGSENTADKAIDGDGSTRWESDYVDDAWIEVDMQEAIAINRIQINWEPSYSTKYTVEVSKDGTTWTTVKNETNGKGGQDVIDFTTADVRYVKVHGTERVQGTFGKFGHSIFEIQVYNVGGETPEPPSSSEDPSSEDPSSTPSEDPSSTPSEDPSSTPSEDPSSAPSTPSKEDPSSTPSKEEVVNLAKGKTVTASSTSKANDIGQEFKPEFAVDGDTTKSRWAKSEDAKDGGDWLMVDFGKATEFDSVTLYWESVSHDYVIEVSNDGKSWKKVASDNTQTANAGEAVKTVNTFAKQNARYVRMVSNASAPGPFMNSYLSVYEFEVYNNGGTGGSNGGNNNGGGSNNPAGGDTSMLALAMALATVSMLGAVVVLKKRAK